MKRALLYYKIKNWIDKGLIWTYSGRGDAREYKRRHSPPSFRIQEGFFSSVGNGDLPVRPTGWDRMYERIFAALYDPLLRSVEQNRFAPLRKNLLSGLRGTVLDLGAGTGGNLPFLSSPEIRVVFLDLSWPMIEKGLAKGMGRAGPVVRGSAETLPFRDGSFDACLSTLLLCSVEDPRAGLLEIRRVLREGGSLLMMEHILSKNSAAAALQRLATPLWKRIAGGCRLDRRTDLLASSILQKKEEQIAVYSGIPFLLGRYEKISPKGCREKISSLDDAPCAPAPPARE